MLPISFTDEMVRLLRSVTKTETRRPVGRLADCRPGDALWVREPFHLSARLDDVAPLAAIQHGAEVAAFAADHARDRLPPAVGRRRYAREMPRAFHRMHLVLRGVRTEQLHDIDDAGARAEGVEDRTAYTRLWNAIHASGKTIGLTPVRWTDNPPVMVLTFDVVLAPLPTPQTKGDKR